MNDQDKPTKNTIKEEVHDDNYIFQKYIMKKLFNLDIRE